MRRSVSLAVVLLCACHDPAAVDPRPDGAVVVDVVAKDVSPPLRELAKLVRPRIASEPREAEPVRRIPHPRMRAFTGTDRVAQRTLPEANIVAPSVSFEGVGAGLAGFSPSSIPPDTDGDIGPNHYVQVVNTSLAVFSRTGDVLLGPVDTSVMWMGFPKECAQTNDGDAVVRYDHIADRWVIAQFSIEGSIFQCIAVSTTPDPMGSYVRYQFGYTALNDYPKVGLWPDGYYFTFNMFGNSFEGGKVCAMDRVKMLAGAPDATMQCFDSGPNFGGLLASDVDGKTLPPPGAPNYVIALDTDTAFQYWQLHVDYATPANSKFTGPTPITVESFSQLCNGGACVTQPSGARLDSLADRAMNRFVYRRFADHESLLLSHAITANPGGGIRWYELRTPNTPTVFQQGTFAPTGAFRWIPSIAMDGSGDIALIYTVSSTTVNPSIRYTARVPADPPGTMGQGEGTIALGAGVQTNIDRWGDYATLNIDPNDDCTFWGTHEYKAASGRTNWSTRIAAFQLPGCFAFTVTANDAQTVKQGGTASYPLITTTLAGTPQAVQLSATGLPTGVTATFDPTSVTTGQPATVQLAADATAAVGTTHYTIAAAGPSSSMVDVTLTVEPADPLPPDAGPNGGDDDGGKASGGCCGAGRGTSPLGSALLGLGVAFLLVRRRARTRN
jgi:hypothetical protein